MTLSKLEVMKQKTLKDLLVLLMETEPGITTQKLWNTAHDWSKARTSVHEFETELKSLRARGYRVTNKQWYPANHVAPPKVSGPKAVHPK
jgi:DNA-binding IclR family transcriptional regulator